MSRSVGVSAAWHAVHDPIPSEPDERRAWFATYPRLVVVWSLRRPGGGAPVWVRRSCFEELGYGRTYCRSLIKARARVAEGAERARLRVGLRQLARAAGEDAVVADEDELVVEPPPRHHARCAFD